MIIRSPSDTRTTGRENRICRQGRCEIAFQGLSMRQSSCVDQWIEKASSFFNF